MNLHKGKILKSAIQESGVTITSLIKKLGKADKHAKCSRTKLYDLFKQQDIESSFLEAIGRIIYHDFSKDIPDLKKNNHMEVAEGLRSDYQSATSELAFFRSAYSKLQESYIELIRLLTKIANENNSATLKREIACFLEKEQNLMK